MLKIRTQARRDAFTLDVSIEMERAGVLALFGRSGCGTTTLVNIIAGLPKADTCHIEIHGALLGTSPSRLSVEAERRKIGHVFQDARLLPHLNIGKHLSYGLHRARKQPLRVSFESVVALLGLEH